MKVMESITSFIHKAATISRRVKRPRRFWGRLKHHLIQAEKPVIIFEHPKIIHSADTVEEATTFLIKKQEEGFVFQAGIYMHDSKAWHKVEDPGVSLS